jgi:hypothetical protein
MSLLKVSSSYLSQSGYILDRGSVRLDPDDVRQWEAPRLAHDLRARRVAEVHLQGHQIIFTLVAIFPCAGASQQETCTRQTGLLGILCCESATSAY